MGRVLSPLFDSGLSHMTYFGQLYVAELTEYMSRFVLLHLSWCCNKDMLVVWFQEENERYVE